MKQQYLISAEIQRKIVPNPALITSFKVMSSSNTLDFMINWLRPCVHIPACTTNQWMISEMPIKEILLETTPCKIVVVTLFFFSFWRFLQPNRTSIFFQVVFVDTAVNIQGAVLTSTGVLLHLLLPPLFRTYNSSHSPGIMTLKPNVLAYVVFLMLMSQV